MEEDRDNGHLKLFDQSHYDGLPLPVGKLEPAVVFGNSAGREESERMTVAHMLYRLPHSVHCNFTLFRVVGFERVNRNESGLHGLKFIKDEIDHYLIVGSERSYQMKEDNAVVASEGVVTDGYEGTLFELFEPLDIVDGQLPFIFLGCQSR